MEKMMLSPAEIYEETINVGIKKAKKSTLKQTFVSGILAGAFIAFGAFAAVIASHSVENYGLSKLVAGSVFPVGLILVLICGAELFTGNSLLVVAYAEKKITPFELVKNLTTVYFGNMVGAVLVALLLYGSHSFAGNHNAIGAYLLGAAYKKSHLGIWTALFSGVLCNFLVSMAVWGSYGARDIIGKIFMAWFPVMAFIISGFEHSVANMYYFAAGLLIKLNPEIVSSSGLTAEQVAGINATSIVNNLISVTAGNLISGMVFVGIAYWSIYKPTHEIDDNDDNKKNPLSNNLLFDWKHD